MITKVIGLTLIETLVALSIVTMLTAIALPNYSPFLAKLRTNNEIRHLHRLLLLARNQAIHSETFVTVCPLNASKLCQNAWHKDLSVFYDINKNKQLETHLGEIIIKQKAAIPESDMLLYAAGRTALVYGPTGRLVIWGGNGTFRYCPQHHSELSRGIIISVTGKAYLSYDINADGREENRQYVKMSCE